MYQYGILRPGILVVEADIVEKMKAAACSDNNENFYCILQLRVELKLAEGKLEQSVKRRRSRRC